MSYLELRGRTRMATLTFAMMPFPTVFHSQLGCFLELVQNNVPHFLACYSDKVYSLRGSSHLLPAGCW